MLYLSYCIFCFWIELGLTHDVVLPSYSAAQYQFVGLNCSSSGTLSRGGSDQSAAARWDKIVPVSYYVLETFLLHLLSEMRTEKEEDRMLGDGAHTSCAY